MFRSILLSATLALAAFADETAPVFAEMRKIDAHSHIFEEIPELNAWMRAADVRIINGCNNAAPHVDTMHAIALEQVWTRAATK